METMAARASKEATAAPAAESMAETEPQNRTHQDVLDQLRQAVPRLQEALQAADLDKVQAEIVLMAAVPAAAAISAAVCRARCIEAAAAVPASYLE